MNQPAFNEPPASGAPLILLADDEPHITHVVARKLSGAGFEIVTAEDGEHAMELARERAPDLVVTDLQMPYMNGIEFARALREHGPTSATPVILLTARGYVLDPDDLAATNIKFVNSKPFSARDILAKVWDLLGGQRELRKSA